MTMSAAFVRAASVLMACLVLACLGQPALCQEQAQQAPEKAAAVQSLESSGIVSHVPDRIVDGKGFTVRGAISAAKPGRIFIKMSTKEQFEKGGPGTHQAILEDLGKSIEFVFYNVLPQSYCIEAFVDVNANGKLDMGAFGPKEPWGNYRFARPRMRAPRFDEMAFEVNADIDGISIRLE
jgi:uncharacterized protein (DUF2141 family)